jgi:hypothetical protein
MARAQYRVAPNGMASVRVTLLPQYYEMESLDLPRFDIATSTLSHRIKFLSYTTLQTTFRGNLGYNSDQAQDK